MNPLQIALLALVMIVFGFFIGLVLSKKLDKENKWQLISVAGVVWVGVGANERVEAYAHMVLEHLRHIHAVRPILHIQCAYVCPRLH